MSINPNHDDRVLMEQWFTAVIFAAYEAGFWVALILAAPVILAHYELQSGWAEDIPAALAVMAVIRLAGAACISLRDSRLSVGWWPSER